MSGQPGALQLGFDRLNAIFQVTGEERSQGCSAGWPYRCFCLCPCIVSTALRSGPSQFNEVYWYRCEIVAEQEDPPRVKVHFAGDQAACQPAPLPCVALPEQCPAPLTWRLAGYPSSDDLWLPYNSPRQGGKPGRAAAASRSGLGWARLRAHPRGGGGVARSQLGAPCLGGRRPAACRAATEGPQHYLAAGKGNRLPDGAPCADLRATTASGSALPATMRMCR